MNETTTNDDDYQSPLSRAVTKARGDILTDDDMKVNIDFLNNAVRKIKTSSEPVESNNLQLLMGFREHLNRRISELSTPNCAPAPQPEPDAGEEWHVGYTKGRGYRVNDHLGCLAEVRSEAIAAELISNHASAVLVPKLVAALELALTNSSHSDSCPSSRYVLRNGGEARLRCECWRREVYETLALAKGREE